MHHPTGARRACTAFDCPPCPLCSWCACGPDCPLVIKRTVFCGDGVSHLAIHLSTCFSHFPAPGSTPPPPRAPLAFRTLPLDFSRFLSLCVKVVLSVCCQGSLPHLALEVAVAQKLSSVVCAL